MRRPGGKSIVELMWAEARKRIGPRSPGAGGINLVTISRALLANRRVVAAFKKSTHLSGLSEVQMAMLAYGGKPRPFKRYATLYREGATAKSFYVLVRGSLFLSTLNEEDVEYTHTVERGDAAGICFGMEALIPGVLRAATCTALADCELVVFSTSDLALDASGVEQLAASGFTATAETALCGTPIFRDLPSEDIAEIAPMFEFEQAGADEQIVAAGERSEKLYVLLDGSVSISKNNFEIKVLDASIGDFGGHPFFGAQAFADNNGKAPNPFSPWEVRTRTPVNLLVMSGKALRKFIKDGAEEEHFEENFSEFLQARGAQWMLEYDKKIGVDLDGDDTARPWKSTSSPSSFSYRACVTRRIPTSSRR
jgi:CRP-like cAMP-binding protein